MKIELVKNRFSGIMALVFGLAAVVPVSPKMQQAPDRAVNDFRAERHREFSDPARSPLEQAEVADFRGLNYFDISSKYRVQARFERTPNEKKFNMPTSSGITKVYLKYGQLRFNLAGSEQVLGVYQSETLSQTEKHKNYLLIPFTDATNGKSTYGGGRYIDFEIPASSVVTLDFNLAYNPSCAYSSRFNCPIPPRKNRLKTKINAGEKRYNKVRKDSRSH
jgi:uncharacterized protein (DUF1684 family)